MTDASDSVPGAKRDSESRPVGTEAGSDDEVFHDARFPAEEEAVSRRGLQSTSRTLANSTAMATEASEGGSRHQNGGKSALRRSML